MCAAVADPSKFQLTIHPSILYMDLWMWNEQKGATYPHGLNLHISFRFRRGISSEYGASTGIYLQCFEKLKQFLKLHAMRHDIIIRFLARTQFWETTINTGFFVV